MLEYKINVIEELSKIGLDFTWAKRNGVFGQATMMKFKNKNTSISIDSMNKLCCVLGLQPGEIFEYIETQEDREILEKLYS